MASNHRRQKSTLLSGLWLLTSVVRGRAPYTSMVDFGGRVTDDFEGP